MYKIAKCNSNKNTKISRICKTNIYNEYKNFIEKCINNKINNFN